MLPALFNTKLNNSIYLIKFADLILNEELKLVKVNGTALNLERLPKKRHKCNKCQNFEASADDSEICQVCNDDEGEHEQVISINYVIVFIF